MLNIAVVTQKFRDLLAHIKYYMYLCIVIIKQ